MSDHVVLFHPVIETNIWTLQLNDLTFLILDPYWAQFIFSINISVSISSAEKKEEMILRYQMYFWG